MPRGKSQKSLKLIEGARELLAGIRPATVRAVCYKLFTLGLIGSMSKNETNKVSRALTWARENGVLDWDWIVDETRQVERASSWNNLAEFTACASRSFRRDYWQNQPQSNTPLSRDSGGHSPGDGASSLLQTVYARPHSLYGKK